MLQGRHWSKCKLICGRAVFIAATAVAAIAPLTHSALAQPSWPTTWNSIGSCSENEPADTNPASVDLVGAPGFPAAFTQTDANYLYLRERIDVNPSGPGTFDGFSWVVLIQTPGSDAFKYQWLGAVNGGGEMVELWQNNQATASTISFSPIFNDAAETIVFTDTTANLARIVVADSALDGEQDYFVDWALPRSTLTANGIDADTALYWFATSANANNFNKDRLNDCAFSPSTTLSLSKSASPSTISTGSTTPVTYTIVVTNTGSHSASGVVISDADFPSWLVISSVMTTAGTVTSMTSSSFEVRITSLAIGASATITVNATSSPAPASPTTFTNTVSAFATNAGNTTAMESLFVAAPTQTPTVSLTPTASRTATQSPTASTTSTPTISSTPTRTATHTATETHTLTPPATPSSTATATLTPTPSSTPTLSSTPTATATRTSSHTVTPTSSTTATVTATSTVTPIVTATATATSTLTSTRTATATSTVPPTPTASATPLATSTRTSTHTATATPTVTSTATATVTPSATSTSTTTPTPSATRTPIEVDQTLVLSYVKLRHDNSITRDNGKAVIRALVDDNDTSGGLETSLLAGTVVMHVLDSNFFDVTFAFSGCSVKVPTLKIVCRSTDRTVKGIFKPTLQGPFVYNVVAVAKKLPVMVTGATLPSGPLAYVFMDQGGHPRSDVIGDIHPCQPSANRELKCRERRRP